MYFNFTWNGTDNNGIPVPAGTYEITASVGGFITNTVTVTLNYCIDISLSTDKNEYTVGEDVEISIPVTNTCDRPVDVTYTTSCHSDMWVVNDEGNEYFNFTWNGTDNNGIPVPAGTYEITASVGGFITNTVTVTFGVAYVKPIVNIFPTTNVITVGDTFIINGTCSHGENNETVEKVEIKIDDGNWITVNGVDDWNFIWNTTNAKSGLHVIKVRAYDGHEYSNIKSMLIEVKEEDQPSKDTAGFEFVIFVGGITVTFIVMKKRKFKK